MNTTARLTPFAFLLVGIAALAAPTFAQTDRFGGNTVLTAEATGGFRIEQIRNRSWFITPEGHGMVALGLNHISEMKNPADYPRTVFARKFGQDWPRVLP